MNITEHALMRYAQRFEDEHISSDNVFKDWKRNNPEKVEKYTKEIEILFKAAEFLTEGIYDKNRKAASFYILEDESLCFILDKEHKNLITIYEIDFGIDKEGNKKILSQILNYIENLKTEKDDFDKFRSEELLDLGRKKKTLGFEESNLRTKLKEIETELQSLNKQIELSNARSKTYTATLENSYRKIIKSIEF